MTLHEFIKNDVVLNFFINKAKFSEHGIERKAELKLLVLQFAIHRWIDSGELEKDVKNNMHMDWLIRLSKSSLMGFTRGNLEWDSPDILARKIRFVPDKKGRLNFFNPPPKGKPLYDPFDSLVNAIPHTNWYQATREILYDRVVSSMMALQAQNVYKKNAIKIATDIYRKKKTSLWKRLYNLLPKFLKS